MRKVLGLFLVITFCGSVAFAQEGKKAQSGKKEGKQRTEQAMSQRSDRMITDLNLDDKQAAEFKQINEKYRKQLQQDRDAMKAERQADREKQQAKMKELNEQRNTDMKKIMTDEQYKQYLDKQQQAQKRMQEGRRGK